MKRMFIKMLPVMAAILLATSCSKDDGGNSVIDNVVAPQEETIQDDVKSSVKTITITGKLSKESLSKVGVSDKTLQFEVGDKFTFGTVGEGNVYGTIEITNADGLYTATLNYPNEDALTSTSFTATLNEHKQGVVEAGKDLAAAVKAACYAIDFKVTKEGDVYKMKSGDASDILVNIESAFINPQTNGWITVSGKSYYVESGNYYIVSNKSKMGAKNAITAGKIYNVSSPAAERTVPEGFVDLGITDGTQKIFWAEKNVGADNAWDYGDYYAWGETATKETYNWTTYEYANGDSHKLTKYCSDSEYGNEGFTDQLTVLGKYTIIDGKDPVDDDVAHEKDPESSMPTTEEWQALANISNCTWVWTDDYPGSNGAKGYIVYAGTGTHTLFEAHIFLPAAGCRSESGLNDAGTIGSYWSSSLYADSPYSAYRLSFQLSNVNAQSNGSRYYGRSVRAVRRK